MAIRGPEISPSKKEVARTRKAVTDSIVIYSAALVFAGNILLGITPVSQYVAYLLSGLLFLLGTIRFFGDRYWEPLYHWYLKRRRAIAGKKGDC